MRHSLSSFTGQIGELRFREVRYVAEAQAATSATTDLELSPTPITIFLTILTTLFTGQAYNNHFDNCGFLWRFP